LSYGQDAKGKLLLESILQLPKALGHPVLNITLPGLSHVIPILETRQVLLLRHLDLRQIDRVRAHRRRTTRPSGLIRLLLRRSIRTALRVMRVSPRLNLLPVWIAIPIRIHPRGTSSWARDWVIWVSTHAKLLKVSPTIPVIVSIRVWIHLRVIDDIRPRHTPPISLLPLYRVRPAISIGINIGAGKGVIGPLVGIGHRLKLHARVWRSGRTYRMSLNIWGYHLVPKSNSSIGVRLQELRQWGPRLLPQNSRNPSI
jgi:hypothetical protein